LFASRVTVEQPVIFFDKMSKKVLNAVAFISPQNHPILIRTFTKQDDHAIKYHYIAHTSLDVIEERG
jgi:hypothetical protein